MSGGGHIPLCKADVLYLGSAVPIETACGVEAFQMPSRERYWSAVDKNMKVDGIDSSVIMYSSGLLMQYTGDPNSITWFPVQSLHACAALKAGADVGIDGRPRFVPLDSPEGLASPHPAMFCAIMRRTRGIKVLECHVFICKSTDAALTMVQGMTHAFEHREGWMPDDALPPIITSNAFGGGGGSGTPIVPAGRFTSSSSWGGGSGGGGGGIVQKYSINAPVQPSPEPPRPALPAPAPALAPAPVAPAPAPAPAPATQAPAPAAPIQYIPVPIIYPFGMQNQVAGSNYNQGSGQVQALPGPNYNQGSGQNQAQCPGQIQIPPQYFANWDMFGGQALMFTPESPFNPDKGHKKKKKKKKSKKNKKEESSDSEEELYMLKKTGNNGDYIMKGSRDSRQVPDDLVIYAPSQNRQTQVEDNYPGQDAGRRRYIDEVIYRPSQARQPPNAGQYLQDQGGRQLAPNAGQYLQDQGGRQPPITGQYLQDQGGPNYMQDFDNSRNYYGDERRVTFLQNQPGGPAYNQQQLQPAYFDDDEDPATRYYADRDAAEYYNAMQEYNRALAESAAFGGVIRDPTMGAGYPDEDPDYRCGNVAPRPPWLPRYGGVVPQRYGMLADGLGYYP